MRNGNEVFFILEGEMRMARVAGRRSCSIVGENSCS